MNKYRKKDTITNYNLIWNDSVRYHDHCLYIYLISGPVIWKPSLNTNPIIFYSLLIIKSNNINNKIILSK